VGGRIWLAPYEMATFASFPPPFISYNRGQQCTTVACETHLVDLGIKQVRLCT
jgi:hypothetical protein